MVNSWAVEGWAGLVGKENNKRRNLGSRREDEGEREGDAWGHQPARHERIKKSIIYRMKGKKP